MGRLDLFGTDWYSTSTVLNLCWDRFKTWLTLQCGSGRTWRPSRWGWTCPPRIRRMKRWCCHFFAFLVPLRHYVPCVLSPSRLAYLSNLCEEFLKNQPQSKRTVISCKVSIVSPGSQFLSRDFPEYLRQAQAHGERGLPCPFNESNIFQHCCHDMSMTTLCLAKRFVWEWLCSGKFRRHSPPQRLSRTQCFKAWTHGTHWNPYLMISNDFQLCSCPHALKSLMVVRRKISCLPIRKINLSHQQAELPNRRRFHHGYRVCAHGHGARAGTTCTTCIATATNAGATFTQGGVTWVTCTRKQGVRCHMEFNGTKAKPESISEFGVGSFAESIWCLQLSWIIWRLDFVEYRLQFTDCRSCLVHLPCWQQLAQFRRLEP